jgi:hypothetical protein
MIAGIADETAGISGNHENSVTLGIAEMIAALIKTNGVIDGRGIGPRIDQWTGMIDGVNHCQNHQESNPLSRR